MVTYQMMTVPDPQQPTDILRKMLALRVPTEWSHYGPMMFTADGIELDGSDESFVEIRNGRANGKLVVRRRAAIPRGINGDVTFSRDGSAVTMPVFVYLSGHHFTASEGERTFFNVAVKAIEARQRDIAVQFSRETILGLYLGRRDEPDLATRFETRVFGRRAIVAGYATKDPPLEIDALQIVYEGPPLTEDERHPMFDVLRFLSGVRGDSIFLEVFDEHLVPLGFRYHYHGSTQMHHDLQPPVNLDRVTGETQIDLLCSEFPMMIEAMRNLRAQGEVAVSATIHHYNDGAIQRYPTSKVRDMSVALEALGVVLLGRQAKTTPIIDAGFDTRIAPVLTAFQNAFSDIERARPEQYSRLRGKLERLNVASPREELFAALSALDIGFSSKERSWISKMRNGVLHSGYHGDESIVTNLRLNAQAAALFANVYTRAMLRKLGFSGRYRDAVSGTSDLPLDIAPDYPLLAD